MPSLFFICPKTRQQADTGILTDVESLRDTWSMTLNVNCPHCGEMHAVSVRETYIDDAIQERVGDCTEGVARRAATRPPSDRPSTLSWRRGMSPRICPRGAQELPCILQSS